MKLPCCWNCQHEFKLRELFLPWKSRCPVCNKKQFLTKESRFNTTLFNPVILIIIFVMNIMSVSWAVMIPIVLFMLLICFSVMPYFYRFTDKEAPFV
ncbi:TIGR04104 family putative zinc finger protein [Oceanobacillus sojae]|uniref:TIGR04104 family putative zinc finger protein n=1 Tax=Oceanobacillus sojae TaxID=582851 RepID=UPI0011BE89B5